MYLSFYIKSKAGRPFLKEKKKTINTTNSNLCHCNGKEALRISKKLEIRKKTLLITQNFLTRFCHWLQALCSLHMAVILKRFLSLSFLLQFENWTGVGPYDFFFLVRYFFIVFFFHCENSIEFDHFICVGLDATV